MQRLLIHVTRASVGISDDVDAPHRQSYILNNAQSIKQIVDQVFQNYPLPSVSPTNYVWVLDAAVSLAMFSPSWPEHRLLLRQDKATADLDKMLSEINLRFRCIPRCTPEKMYEIFSSFHDPSSDDNKAKDYFTIRIEDEIDPELSPEEYVRAALLTQNDLKVIDDIILENCTHRFRKVAMVVAYTLNQVPSQFADLADIFFSYRVRVLVAEGKLDGLGNLHRMRFSEVRLPTGHDNDA